MKFAEKVVLVCEMRVIAIYLSHPSGLCAVECKCKLLNFPAFEMSVAHFDEWKITYKCA